MLGVSDKLGWHNMEESERELLARRCREAEENKTFFSNPGKVPQERTVVAGLLRVLGVEFREDEIIKGSREPIDVSFRKARFQVTQILDQGRRQNLDFKERSARAKSAKRIEDLCRQGNIGSHPIAPNELIALISKRCQGKTRRYAGDCSDIDLLIYVNLQSRHMDPSGPFPDGAELTTFGWRSVSVIGELVALVLCVADDAPPFLIKHCGQPVFWPGIESVFPKLAADNGKQSHQTQTDGR